MVEDHMKSQKDEELSAKTQIATHQIPGIRHPALQQFWLLVTWRIFLHSFTPAWVFGRGWTSN
jgi:hypothetical protein